MPPATQCSHELRVELFIRNRRAMLLTGGAPAAFANAVLDALWPLGIIHVDPPFTSENFGKRSSEQRPESTAHSLFKGTRPQRRARIPFRNSWYGIPHHTSVADRTRRIVAITAAGRSSLFCGGASRDK